jgi:hypothetical protein
MEDEGKLFAAFDKAPEFFEKLPIFLDVDLQREPTPTQTQTETALLHKLIMIVRGQDPRLQYY